MPCVKILLFSTLCTMGLFFGLLFGFIYDDIQVSFYVPTTCTVLEATIKSRYCCSRECTSCSSIYNVGYCSDIINYKQGLDPEKCNGNVNDTQICAASENCNGGYKCCATICATCKSCSTNSKGVRSCHSYACNCVCASSTNSLSCRTVCDLCYTTKIMVKYNTKNETITSNIDKNFDRNLNGANSSLYDYIDRDVPCYYNYFNDKQVLFNKTMPDWKIAIFCIFGIVPLYAMLIIDTFYLLDSLLIKDSIIIAVIIWASIVPFIILLPLYTELGIVECLVFAIIAVCIGIGAIFFKLCENGTSWPKKPKEPYRPNEPEEIPTAIPIEEYNEYNDKIVEL